MPLDSLNTISNTALIISAAILIAAAVLYAFEIKKTRPSQIDPTHNLPDGVGAAEAAFTLYGDVTRRDITALCLQLILDGNMKIVAGNHPDDAILLQCKKPGRETPRYMALFWLELFRGRSAIAVPDIGALCPDIIKLTKKRIRLKYEGELQIRAYMMVRDAVIMGGALLFGAVMAYAIYSLGARIGLSALLGFAAFLGIYIPELNFLKSLDAIKSTGRIVRIKPLGWCAAYAAAAAVVAWIAGKCGVGAVFILKLVAVSALLTAAAALIKRPSERGRELSAHLLGLKAFMQASQNNVSDIRRLLRREPEYFFKALPYAYALRVQDAWLPNIKYNAVQKSEYILSEKQGLSFEEVFYRAVEALNGI